MLVIGVLDCSTKTKTLKPRDSNPLTALFAQERVESVGEEPRMQEQQCHLDLLMSATRLEEAPVEGTVGDVG